MAAALATLGADQGEAESCWRLLAAVLHLGNLSFDPEVTADNKALFADALSKSSKMKKAHDARIARKKTTPAARKRRRNPTISSDESEGESDGAREEATWIDGVPVWSRCVPRMSA